MFQKKLASLLHPTTLIFLLWLIALIIINPIGEFPLNDDWAYSLVVKEWLDTGVYHVSDWPAMSLFAQICWGSLFAKVFGFSFTVLRVSTLVAGILGVYAFDLILKELKVSNSYRALAIGALLFNPLFFHLSCTFMTDVPFLSSCVIASYFHLKFIQKQQFYWWLAAIFFSCIAILTRQLGLFVPLAFTAALIFNFRNIKTNTLVLSVLGVCLTYASLKGYIYYLDQTTGIPTAFSEVDSIVSRLNFNYIYNSTLRFGGVYLMYITAFLLPVLIRPFWARSKFFYVALSLTLLLLVFLIQYSWDKYPLGNIIYDLGLGVVTLPDAFKNITTFSGLDPRILISFKILILCGVLLLAGHLAKGGQRLFYIIGQPASKEQIFKLGALFFILAYAFFLIIDYYRFDRYILPALPFLMVLLLPKQTTNKPRLIPLSLGALFIMGVFSISATSDYFSWNKARWEALSYIEDQAIPPSKIDGGFEYNGWHQTHYRNPDNPYSKSWWFVDEDDYTIAFQPFHNYEPIASFPFKKILNFSIDTIYALQRPNWHRIDTFFYNMEGIDSIQEMSNIYTRFSPDNLPVKNITAYSGGHTFNMKEQDAYALNHQLHPVKPYEQLSISMYIKGDKKSFGIVTSAPNEKDFHYSHQPFKVKKEANDWTLVTAEMKIPSNFPSDTLQLYLWKQKAQPLQIDDVKIIWRQY